MSGYKGRHIMLIMINLCFLTFVSTKAARCGEYPHCSVCDLENMTCSGCDNGYYGSTCGSVCSNGCKNRTCVLTSEGIGRCTDGCVSGFGGPNCKLPCYRPAEICSACPGGCEGGYCQLGSSCVSGCKDGFYGSGCKECSSRCKPCNRINGTCDECHPSYFGLNCTYLCDHCQGSCKFGCEHGCVPGYYGIFCDKDCSKHCQAVSDMNSSTTRSPECSRETGDCVKGCVDGWYGATCSSQCNPRCLYKRCSPSGGCVDGCVPGYFGSDCMPCPDNCVNNSCNTDNGSCIKCDNGFYGMSCNQSCCLDGVCDTTTGLCSDGCNITGYRCDSTCTNNCTDTGVKTPDITRGLQIGIPTAFALLLICIVIVCILLRKGCFSDTEQHTVEAGTVEYHRYWQIGDDHIDLQRPESVEGQDVNIVMPVIADCSPAACAVQVSDHDTSDGSASGTSDGSTTDSQAYTHLVRDPDVRAADPGAVVHYISPTQPKRSSI
ncbi:scavenger receptor class F member 1-like [Haliotis cracherodii]|uniref:scavenger receptor class F member 1-like n=1 Tax=Haliotis cracherodii TaxID=6455 RepID=UPI0039E8B1BB